MITNAGGGYSRWNDLAVTRWREDGTCDNWGTFCYIRALPSGEFWSAAFQPALQPSDSYEAIFSDARAEFRRRDRGFDTHTEIAVSPEDDIELRRITHHQHLALAQDHRSHQLRGGGTGLGGRPTRCIPRSATCSCRPRFSANSRRFSARAGRVRARSTRRGCAI